MTSGRQADDAEAEPQAGGDPDAERLGRPGRARPLPWEALEVDRLDGRKRRIVGASWRHRMEQEHLAVGVFARLAARLAADGCSRPVLALAARASADEVRHAEICRQYAAALLDEQLPQALHGSARMPSHEAAGPRAQLLFHVVEMCCISETLTGVYFTELLERTADPLATAVVQSLLQDELDHGRLGWAYLAERARKQSLDGLTEALPGMLDRTVGRVVGTGAQPTGGGDGDDDPEMERFAYMTPRRGAAVTLRSLHDVILPGFESVGLDLAPVHAHVREQGWDPPATSAGG